MFMNKFDGMIEKSLDLNLLGSRLADFDGPKLFSYSRWSFRLIKHDLDGGSEEVVSPLGDLSDSVRRSMELVDCSNGRFIFFSRYSLLLIF